MTDLSDLIRAVVDNPGEDAPLSMLADHLLEKGDGRGEIVRQWLADDRNDPSGSVGPGHAQQVGKGWMHTTLHRLGSQPAFSLILQHHGKTAGH